MADIRRIKEEIAGVASIAGGLYLGLCLVGYSRWDPSLFTFSTSPVRNYGGIVGSYIADFFMTLSGVSAYAIPVFLLIYGFKSLLGKERHKVHLIGAVLFVISASILSGLITSSFQIEYDAGGAIGRVVSGIIVGGLSVIGAYILALALFFSSLILLSPVSLIQLIIKPKGDISPPLSDAVGPPSADAAESIHAIPNIPEGGGLNMAGGVDPMAEAVGPPEPPAPPEPMVLQPDFPPLPITDDNATEEVLPVEEEKAGVFSIERGDLTDYVLPPVELLNMYEQVSRPSKEDIINGSTLLEKKLSDYGVQGKVMQVHTGPVVTMYEYEPAPGTKIVRIISLTDDLALAMRAQSVRVSPVQGKAAIGIEIPNRQRETVSLREMISSEGFKKSQSKLTLAFGKDIFGNPIVADLTRMPHLLVAGATGSGKSVFLNSIVMSILYKAAPSEVKMLMIDPKLLELSSYDGIPHLIAPVVTAPKEAAEMLKNMVFEMERRYRLIAEKGARNIDSFNASATEEERLPYIVVLIDELADLMFVSASQVEDSIARLAQMARASGIHLILATQRPSVDVITGLIKANFPARVAFQVTSRIDSRTIIDAQGAEQLIGRGDMLFMLPGLRIVRVHGALVTEGEVRAVVDFVKTQGKPDYSVIETIQEEAEAAAEGTGERDELYSRALEFAESAGEVSISSLQRRLKVGYNRAARIMELMEEDNLVGPPKGAGKPRDFLRRGPRLQ